MTTPIDTTIAVAILSYLEGQLGAGPAARAFVRIEGFSELTYGHLFSILTKRGFLIGERRVIARSTKPITGHEALALNDDKTATAYRNDVPPGQTLLLILNRRTSDAQSLKDIFAIGEHSLTRDGLRELIEASIVRYELDATQHASLVDFVRRLRRLRMEPQLRDLAEFLQTVDAGMANQAGTPLADAIAEALPALNLFRCRDFATLLNTPRGDKLLRQLKDAAQLGTEILDEQTRQAHLGRLKQAALADDSGFQGLSRAEKVDLLQRFIDGSLADNRAELLRVLSIDWHEVRQVILTRGRAGRPERYRDLAERLATEAETAGLPETEALADVVESLRDGRDPETEVVEQVLGDEAHRLNKGLRNELRRLVRPPTRRAADFLAGLTALAVDLLHARQDTLAEGARLRVTLAPAALEHPERLREAALVFRAIYGGVERIFPAVQWELERLWSFVQVADTSPESDELEQLARAELPFRVAVLQPGAEESGAAELIWQYRSDSPAAATAQTFAALSEQLEELSRQGAPALPVPIFNRCNQLDEIGDLDLSHPLASLGAWYEVPGNLRAVLEEQLKPITRGPKWEAVDTALAGLERTWSDFVRAARHGLAGAEPTPLLHAYDALLATCLERLQGSSDVAATYRLLNQAWLIGPPSFARWAVVPLFHPLKLFWWRERTRAFNDLVAHLLDPARPAQIVDVRRFKHELSATFGSSGFPPVLALPPADRRPAERFLPTEEAEGYELFVRERFAAEAVGLDTDLLAEDENEIAARRAVEGIGAVVQDYIETYPFVRDGVEIFVYDCRNGALPGMLIDQLTTTGQRRGWSVRLTLVVHTRERGAPLFRRVSTWLAGEHKGTEREGQAYFPPIMVKVLQAEPEALFRQQEDTDIVILADVLAERGQEIKSELEPLESEEPSAQGYLPTYRARQEPFQRDEQYRRMLLSPPQPPAVVRHFLLAQHAAVTSRAPRPGFEARFYRELSLEAWNYEIEQLHRRFNWVICYDTSIDRFLLQAAFRDSVQVIRYSLGLGAKRQHNLTVSSSGRAQAIVINRLAARLRQMFPSAASFCAAFADRLVAEAKEISGDIVLRAAGPGAFLNELIGLVAAKFATERRFRAEHPGALTTWILLDDFEHWFDRGKFPDLLFVALDRDADGGLLLRLQVLEAKCVGELSFAAESSDAEEQVRRGVSRLVAAFAPGDAQLDALYWYDQLYRAVAGNLAVEPEQQALWELFRDNVHRGAFRLDLSGHTWAFCYDGQGELQDGPLESSFTATVESSPDVLLRAHHYGRGDLAALLLALVHERDGLVVPPEAMAPPVQELGTAEPSSKSTATIAPVALAQNPTLDVGSTAHHPADHGEEIAQSQPTVESSETPPTTPGLMVDRQWLADKARELERALRQRGVQLQRINPDDADVGPSIVRFKLRLSGNETVKKLQTAALDLARDLSLTRTPFIDNVLGTNFVGVDVPREQPEVIELLPLLREFTRPASGELSIIIGKTPDGKMYIDDLAMFPHVLVAGATGSGKSVFLRSMLLSLITQYQPGQIELLIVDPKQTDFSFFDGLPYLRGGKVFTNAGEARDVLLELVRVEMPRRQQLMRGRSMRIKDFNKRFPDEALPPIVAMIDEYAQLLSIMNKKDGEQFERDLMSLAAVARATSIHLVLATQRPSVDVVTGTLKANLPTRIAFQVPTNSDSRVVLDTNGAENLLGQGDMLFRRPSGEVVRLQAPFMDEEQMQSYLAALVAT